MSDDGTLVALGAGGALAAAALLARRLVAAGSPSRSGLWVWPVPALGDRQPKISDGWGSPRPSPNGTTRRHRGVDIMYRRRTRTDLATLYPPGTVNGSPHYFMPDDVPALAAADGFIHEAHRTSRGFAVVIVHAGGWATFYTHIERLAVEPAEVVAAGHPLGIIGFDPTDHQRLKHLHFELWRHGSRHSAIDPAPYLAAWHRVALPGWSPPMARNGGLVYRPVGSPGEPYPDWVRRLRGHSGVYVIRQGGDTVYVGESHSSRLYETLTRHFQTVRHEA